MQPDRPKHPNDLRPLPKWPPDLDQPSEAAAPGHGEREPLQGKDLQDL
jgi:hypothetical protein